MQTVIVRTGNEEYALPVESVISIEKLEYVTPIPHLPSYLLGLMKSRGELVPILDLSQILYHQATPRDNDTHVVVVKTDQLEVGLLVLDAREILELPEDRLTSTALKAYSKTPYFVTVANLDDRVVTVIDPNIMADSLHGMDEISSYMKEQHQSN
ncbi:chemotaxis protein CheW [Sporosarcina sp. P12(2017)]|uniref:Chemotaxis protein CheW n=1 Tax=Sporosarcina ureae TaxID=1571 RepID=A0ABM6JRD9_SPOUR|nr:MULTISPECIES: CheW domain-containing protein [Sporosarcina]ARF12785.1 chemotaxis protein CheW [Sporosarcina ureae]PIC59193.1 chemotaxis protein CheW [Sporosarcina sp. P10]PIC62514.1 chemotaxis protein CheW [Sporosarcina sp. P12(2017)]PIC75460.1 chemotaxis protein CheW [Sporosarcina sp. P19]